METSYGFIETRGYIAAIEAADAMVKAAKVQLIQFRQIGEALVTVIVEGPLDSCQAAVQAGKAAAERVGELVSAHVIPRPYKDLDMFTSNPVKEIPKPEHHQVKTGKPAKIITEDNSQTDEEKIVGLISASRNGLKLEEISERLKIDSRKSRILLKALMDNNKVEKIQQKYFPVKKGGRS
jgi:ethanolamine utilization protein EutM